MTSCRAFSGRRKAWSFTSPRSSVASRSAAGVWPRTSRRARPGTTARRAIRWRTTRPCATPGFYALNIPTALGGAGVGLLAYSLAAEELAQGCASTALSFNMHLSIVGPLMESPLVPAAVKKRVARRWWCTTASSSPATSRSPRPRGWSGRPVPLTRARRVDGGYRITGRKAFASMLEAADYCAVMAYPDEATAPTAAMILLVPREAAGRRVEAVWDTLGMRATRSDSMVLDDCWVSDDALVVRADDILPFRRDGANWFWGSYTAVYLGIAVAAYKAIVETVRRANAARASRSRWPIIRTCAGTWRR